MFASDNTTFGGVNKNVSVKKSITKKTVQKEKQNASQLKRCGADNKRHGGDIKNLVVNKGLVGITRNMIKIKKKLKYEQVNEKKFDGDNKMFDRDNKTFDRDNKMFDTIGIRSMIGITKKPDTDRNNKKFDGDNKTFDRDESFIQITRNLMIV